jgi:hypothetical protein
MVENSRPVPLPGPWDIESLTNPRQAYIGHCEPLCQRPQRCGPHQLIQRFSRQGRHLKRLSSHSAMAQPHEHHRCGITNSGVECGDIWDASGLCAYHAHQMAKDD